MMGTKRLHLASDRKATGLWASLIFLVSLNLRPSIAAVGPVLERIGSDLGWAGGLQGMLAAIPLAAFAAVSPLVPSLTSRIGVDCTILLALIAIALGGRNPFVHRRGRNMGRHGGVRFGHSGRQCTGARHRQTRLCGSCRHGDGHLLRMHHLRVGGGRAYGIRNGAGVGWMALRACILGGSSADRRGIVDRQDSAFVA